MKLINGILSFLIYGLVFDSCTIYLAIIWPPFSNIISVFSTSLNTYLFFFDKIFILCNQLRNTIRYNALFLFPGLDSICSFSRVLPYTQVATLSLVGYVLINRNKCFRLFTCFHLLSHAIHIMIYFRKVIMTNRIWSIVQSRNQICFNICHLCSVMRHTADDILQIPATLSAHIWY